MFTKKKINFSFNFVSIIISIIFAPLLLSLINSGIQKVIHPEKKVKLSFKRNYTSRDQLLLLNKHIKESLFNSQLIPDRAINLNNGWYVVGDAFSDALSESKGMVVFTKKELLKLKETLIKRNTFLKENNIKFYVAIAPNKLTTYDTLVPIHKKTTKTKLQQLDSLCQSINVSFINMGQDFKAHKDLRLYHKTDTHWNDLGGFIGYSTAINTFKKDFPNNKFKNFKLENTETYITNDLEGDLTKMLKTGVMEEFIHIKLLDSVFSKVNDKKRHVVPQDYKKEPQNYELRYSNDREHLKLLAFRDSFWGYSNAFFAENFKETVLIWGHIFNTDVILKEKPDIVIIEIVERDIDLLLKNKR